MHVNPSQRRGVGDVEGDDHVLALPGVGHVGDNGRNRIDTEIVRDRLLHLRRTVVVRRQRQLVGTVRQALECIGTQVERRRLVAFFDPGHPAGTRADTRLPVLVTREGCNLLSGGVRVRGVEGVDAAQRARARFEDGRSTRGLGPRDHVAVSLGQTRKVARLGERVVSEDVPARAVIDTRG